MKRSGAVATLSVAVGPLISDTRKSFLRRSVSVTGMIS